MTDIPEIYLYPLIFTFLPFVFSIFFTLLLFLWKKDNTLRSIIKNFFFCFSLSSFLLQSNIYNYLMEVLNCELIDGNYYIKSYLSESCQSENYKMWISFLIIPSSFFYLIIIPGIQFSFMIKNYEKLEIKKYLGFSLVGLGKSKFYW